MEDLHKAVPKRHFHRSGEKNRCGINSFHILLHCPFPCDTGPDRRIADMLGIKSGWNDPDPRSRAIRTFTDDLSSIPTKICPVLPWEIYQSVMAKLNILNGGRRFSDHAAFTGHLAD